MKKMSFLKIIFLVLLSNLHCSYSVDPLPFKYTECYQKNIDQKMPLSIDNFIAIVENFERENLNTNPQNIANAILYRYRINGITYNPKSKGDEWTVTEYKESLKQDLDDKLLKPSIKVPQDTFVQREECSLHMMTSHSVDFYPHAGVDNVWDNTNINNNNNNNNYDSYNNNNNYRRTKRLSFSSDDDIYNTLSGQLPAEHPIEFGVIETNSGPVAGGLLIAGILASGTSRAYSVSELLGSETSKEKFPPEMLSKTIQPLYGATISGELAQAALLSEETAFALGPIGLFGNCSACPRLFSLQNRKISYLSRAELFGALDGFIIGKYVQDSSSGQTILLSEILRMYYGIHGLFNQDLRSCNRVNLFNKLSASYGKQIREQALNYMYAYQKDLPGVRKQVEQYQNEFLTIEKTFGNRLDSVITVVKSFMSSYSYDDPGYNRCPNVFTNEIQYETQVDLVVIYSPVGSTTETEIQKQYIGLTARKVGVGYHRSRLAVLNGVRPENPINLMTNYSNIADYVCNYTTYTGTTGGNSQNFLNVLDKLTEYYNYYYSFMREDPDLTGRNSQVVLWNLPNSFEGVQDEMLKGWYTFNMTFPDVTFIFAGSKNNIQPLTDFDTDELIFITTTSQNPNDISNLIFLQIQKAPRMFLYAACDTLNEAYDRYNENSHVYTTYVSPNYTTILRIPPQNFRYSEFITLNIKKSNVRVCISRINREPSEDIKNDETTCSDTPITYEQEYLCDRYIDQCDPIYISIKGMSDNVNQLCSDDLCVYPNQIEFQMTHEGMICAAPPLRPTYFILLLIFIIICFRM